MLKSLLFACLLMITMNSIVSQLPSGNCLSISCGTIPYVQTTSANCPSAQQTKSNEYSSCCGVYIPPSSIECRKTFSAHKSEGG